ncbi:hypothetical protein IV102_11880 [bacterium]|nr:hypothetical protein [bacterium]
MIDEQDPQAYFDDELAPGKREEIQSRLDSFPADGQRLKELQVLHSRLQSLPRVSPPGLAERVRAQLPGGRPVSVPVGCWDCGGRTGCDRGKRADFKQRRAGQGSSGSLNSHGAKVVIQGQAGPA